MPFFKSVKKQKKQFRRVSLQVQKSKKQKIKLNKNGKRACPFTSFGSITIEAAIAIALFTFIMFVILGFIIMLNTQLDHQIKNNNTAMKLAKAAFLSKKINNKEEVTKDHIDMHMSYFIKIPYINKRIYLTQRCFLKDWSGTDITQDVQIVYITKNGKVYHTTKECSHLSINIRKSSMQQLETERNCYGQKYYKCSICVTEQLSSNALIFITEDGNKYHNTLMCSGLMRNIIEVDKNKIKDMPPCSACAK